MTPKSILPAILTGTLPEIAARLGNKTPIGSVLNSAEWADVAAQLREEAFFSARIESVRALGEMQRGLIDLLEQTRRENGTLATDRSKWIADMQAMVDRLGLRPSDPGKIGTLQDIGSERRLQLIREMQLSRAQNKAKHISGQDPAILNEFPAQELIREVDSAVPRDWQARWTAAGGELLDGGRMVALKTDPIWTAISRFGTPYPPFDYNSGMGLIDIDRDEAEALGLIEPGVVMQPSLAQEEDQLEAGLKKELEIPGMRDALADVFGDQIIITPDGSAKWRK
jgi:hypothetical protein